MAVFIQICTKICCSDDPEYRALEHAYYAEYAGKISGGKRAALTEVPQAPPRPECIAVSASSVAPGQFRLSLRPARRRAKSATCFASSDRASSIIS